MNFNTKIICFWHSFRTISLDLIISQLFGMFPNSLISRKPNLLSSCLNPINNTNSTLSGSKISHYHLLFISGIVKSLEVWFGFFLYLLLNASWIMRFSSLACRNRHYSNNVYECWVPFPLVFQVVLSSVIGIFLTSMQWSKFC